MRLGAMMIGTVGRMSVLLEVSCLRICVYLMLVCGGGRYDSSSNTGIGTRLGSVRSGKAWEMVCVAGDLYLVRSQLSSCVARRVAVIIADIHSVLVHGPWYFGGYGNGRAK